MTAKEYLMQARRIQVRIDQLERAKADAWERATSTTAAPDRGGVSGGDVSRKSEAYGDLSAALAEEYDRLMRTKAEIVTTISKVRDNTLSALLLSYYVNGQTWEQTAVNIHYSYYRTVHDKHPAALEAVNSILLQNVIDCDK